MLFPSQAPTRVSAFLLLLTMCVGCPSSKTRKPPAPEPPKDRNTVAENSAQTATTQDEQRDRDQAEEEPESDVFEPDFRQEHFNADLDGKGDEEAINWSCEHVLSVQVGSTLVTEKLGLAEVLGCSAAVVNLRPGAPERQLLVTVDEHEEAGPDLHFLYSYDGARLTRLWTESAELVLKRDGSWITSTTECDESDSVYRTTTKTMRWDGKTVTATEAISTEPLSADECSEP